MSDELKTCPFCGGEAKITRTRYVFSNNQIREAFAAVCDNDSKKECPGRLCFCRAYDTEAEAIAAWNHRAGESDADDDYERRMDELLCRLTNGKWSKSRSYSVDFMVSCVDEAYEDASLECGECERVKHGTKQDGTPRYRCSVCGYGLGDYRWAYCPKCGREIKDGAE